MSLKTAYNYSEDDFVQHGEGLVDFWNRRANDV